MTFKFDHVIIGVHDLDKATANYRKLGFNVVYGGRHASGSTHNALICFEDSSYVELMAPTGKSPKPGFTDYLPLLQGPERYIGYCLHSDNLARDVAAMRTRGAVIDDPQPGNRARPDGQQLRWQTAMVPGNMVPFFIQDETPRNLRIPDDDATIKHENGVLGMSVLTLLTRSLDQLVAETERYEKLLGLEPEMRGSRHASFRLGRTRLWMVAAKEDDPVQQTTLAGQDIALHTLGLSRLGDDSVERGSETTKLFNIALTHGVRML